MTTCPFSVRLSVAVDGGGGGGGWGGGEGEEGGQETSGAFLAVRISATIRFCLGLSEVHVPRVGTTWACTPYI